MTAPQIRARPALATLALTVLSYSVATPAAHAQSPWEYALSMGYVAPFTYMRQVYPFGSYSQSMGGAPFLTAAVRRSLFDRLQVEAGLGFAEFEKNGQLVIAYSLGYEPLQPGGLRINADVIPIWAGLRFAPVTGPKSGDRFYVEAAPALYWSRWHARALDDNRIFYITQPGETGTYIPSIPSNASFQKLVPGFLAGGGLQHGVGDRVSFSAGVRYLWSARIGEQQRGPYLSGNFEGMRQFVYTIGIGWTP